MTKILGAGLAMFGLLALAQQSLVTPLSGVTDERWGLLAAMATMGGGLALARGRRRPWTQREEAFHRLYVRSRRGFTVERHP